jgi:transposase-like protein
MTEPTSAQDLFKGRHFDQEIIVLCIRWYLTFKLSSRDLVQMMAERGSVADRYIPHAASTLYHTWKGSVPKLSGRPDWPLMIL